MKTKWFLPKPVRLARLTASEFLVSQMRLRPHSPLPFVPSEFLDDILGSGELITRFVRAGKRPGHYLVYGSAALWVRLMALTDKQTRVVVRCWRGDEPPLLNLLQVQELDRARLEPSSNERVAMVDRIPFLKGATLSTRADWSGLGDSRYCELRALGAGKRESFFDQPEREIADE